MGKYLLANNGKFSGTADLITYCRNGVFRNWVDPINTSTGYKSFILDGITYYSQAWRTLSQSEMNSWYIDKSKSKNVFRNSNVIDGINYFISVNMNAALILGNNNTIHLFNPIVVIVAPVPISSVVLNFSALTLAISIPLPSPACSYLVYCSDNLSPGINKPRRCDFRMVAITDFFGGTVDIKSEWSTRFSSSPNTGAKIFVKIVSYNNTSFVKYPSFVTSAIVT